MIFIITTETSLKILHGLGVLLYKNYIKIGLVRTYARTVSNLIHIKCFFNEI